MAFRQTYEAAAGAVRGAVTGAQPTVVLVNYTIPAGVVVNDITEACAIPHGCYVTDATVFQDGLGAGCTVDVGVLTGVYGKNDAARTMGNEIHAALAVATAGASAKPTKNLMAIAPAESAQGVGIKFLGANPTAGKKLTLALTCVSK
jgi:hypothetical protein